MLFLSLKRYNPAIKVYHFKEGAMAKLCVVSENKAKFKVFKVDRDYKAKWNKPHKYQNML